MEPMACDVEPSMGHPHLEKEGEAVEQPEAESIIPDEDVEEDTAIDLDRLLLRPSPFAAESGVLALAEFEAGAELKELVGQARVLVVGAGGLGCEILKNLALSGVKVRGCMTSSACGSLVWMTVGDSPPPTPASVSRFGMAGDRCD